MTSSHSAGNRPAAVKVAASARPNGATAGKMPQPDAELQGRAVQVRLLDGKTITGRLERVSTYLLVIRLADGRLVRVYKDGVTYVMEN